jgi:hypothetical protein
MYQTALTTQPRHRSGQSAYEPLNDPTRGLEDQASSEARRDPTAGHVA